MIGPQVPQVVKLGGREILPGPTLADVAARLAQSIRGGRPTIIVHGGGEEVSDRAAQLGLPTERRAGLRVTSEAMLEVVTEVLAGRVNVRLVRALEAAGAPSIGLTGVSDRLLAATPTGDPPGSLGRVGTPTAVNTRLLRGLLERGFTPVVAPLGVDPEGNVLNLNADAAAGAIAGALSADLVLVTDVPSVQDRAGARLSLLSISGATDLIASGVARDGMGPKLTAACDALGGGARSAWIGDARGIGPRGPPRVAGTRITVAARARAPSGPAETRLSGIGT